MTKGTPSTTNADQSVHIHHLLDWVTYTVPYEVGYENAFLSHSALFCTGEKVANHKGYDTTLRLTHGRVSFHTQYPKQKISVSFTGSELAHLVDKNVPLYELLSYALRIGGKFTRLDFALDYFGPSSAYELQEASDQMRLRTAARNVTSMKTTTRTRAGDIVGYTTYIGSRRSERYVCCYDKGVKEGKTEPWTRIELRTSKSWGQRLGKSMVASGIGEAGKQFIRDYIQCDIPWFVEATTGPSVQVQPFDDDEANPKGWLLNNVLPVLRRELEAEALEGSHELRDAYRDAVGSPSITVWRS
jgi:hypothetical protein